MAASLAKHRSRWTLVLLALAAAGLVALLAGCGSSTSGSGGGAATTSTTPKTGGTLNVSFQGEPTGLDPAVAWEIESWSIGTASSTSC